MSETGPPSESELEQMKDQVMNSRSLAEVSDENLPYLHDYCRKLKAQYLEEEEFLQARDVSELADYCKSEMQYRQASPATNRSTEPLDKTIAGKQMSEWDKKIQDHDEKHNKKLQSLKEKHASDLEKFETEWHDVMPDKYRRPSKGLIEMRQTYKNLAYAGKFEEAQARKEEADALETKEQANAKVKLDNDYKEAKKKLLAKQAEEIANIEESSKLQRDLLLSKKRETKYALDNRKQVLGVKSTQKTRGSKSGADLTTSRAPTTVAPTRKNSTAIERRLPPIEPPNNPGSQPSSPSQQKPNQSPPKQQPQKQSPPAKQPAQQQDKSPDKAEDKEQKGILGQAAEAMVESLQE